jgi:hypothetical protein
VDTSHLSFLARAAQEVAARVSDVDAEIVFMRLVRATACWRTDRLMTTSVVFDKEMDPASGDSRIGEYLRVRSEDEWLEFIGVVDDAAAHDIMDNRDVDTRGPGDCSLIGNGLVKSRSADAYLLTNDEGLIKYAYDKALHVHRHDPDMAGTLHTISSVHACARLHECGAISIEVAHAALVAEYQHTATRPMKAQLREKKLQRIRKVASTLALPENTFEEPKIDDEDIRRYFLEMEE